MGSRDVDELKEVGCEIEIVSCSVEKLVILCYLV